jgi:hypothetical protein
LKEEMLPKIEANEEKMMAKLVSHPTMNYQLEKVEAAVRSNREEVNATDLEENPKDTES